jgi:hypothetical protein
MRHQLRSHTTLPALNITPYQARFVLLTAGLSVLASAALCVLAVLMHAPAFALPLLVPVCVGGPVLASWEVPPALISLRLERAARATRARAIAGLRDGLGQLPETEHPLGL